MVPMPPARGRGPSLLPFALCGTRSGSSLSAVTEHLFHVGTLCPCSWDSPRSNVDRNLIGEFVVPLLSHV